MKLICVMPVRNEEWILGLSARAAMMWCDELVLLVHASTDRTLEIGADLMIETDGRVRLLVEESTVWEEMRHRQRLLDHARSRGATHIAIVDADEVLSGNLLPHVRELVAATPEGSILQLPWVCLRKSIYHAHCDGVWGEQFVSMAFPDDPDYHWQARQGYDFHHRHPMTTRAARIRNFRPIKFGEGGLLHLQFASDRRLRAKQALYKLTELLRWPGREPVDVVDKRYNLAVYGSDGPTAGYKTVPLAGGWWEPYAALITKHLDVDAEPWQETECRRLVRLHGLEYFAGLDLFGVI